MSNKHYIYFDSYVNITKYEKFLDEFIRNNIIKNEIASYLALRRLSGVFITEFRACVVSISI